MVSDKLADVVEHDQIQLKGDLYRVWEFFDTTFLAKSLTDENSIVLSSDDEEEAETNRTAYKWNKEDTSVNDSEISSYGSLELYQLFEAHISDCSSQKSTSTSHQSTRSSSESQTTHTLYSDEEDYQSAAESNPGFLSSDDSC